MADEPVIRSITIAGMTFTPEEFAVLFAEGGSLFLTMEAIASCALDRDPDGQTRVIEGPVTVGEPDEESEP